MALIKTVNASDMYHLACEMGRGKDFGYKGWKAIGEYLEQLSDDIGQDMEVDIIGLCCDYSMAESADDWNQEYGTYSDIDPEEWANLTEDEKLEKVEDYLQEHTSVVICENDCIIWQAF